VIAVEKEGSLMLPPPVYNFSITPLDGSHIKLSWSYTAHFDSFRVYRGNGSGSLEPIGLTIEKSFIDSCVQENNSYWYSVTAVDLEKIQPESKFTDVINTIPKSPPYLKSVQVIAPDVIRAEFSRKMDDSLINPSFFNVSPGDYSVSSLEFADEWKAVIIFLSDEILQPGEYLLSISSGVIDIYGILLDPQQSAMNFSVPEFFSQPYIVTVEQVEDRVIRILFNVPMEKSSVENKDNYSFDPFLVVSAVQQSPENSASVLLTIDPSSPIGIQGDLYSITIRNIMSEEGQPIREDSGNTLMFRIVPESVSYVSPFPNPCNVSDGMHFVKFANLPHEATIWIANIHGQLIKRLDKSLNDSVIQWNLDDENGNAVPSGIYIYHVEGNNQSKNGKIGVIR